MPDPIYCPLAALDQPYVLNVKKCMSYLLQNENLTKKVQIVMENRIGDCEICQQACSWNRKHLDSPLVMNMTEFFQKKIEDWEKLFFLPDLVELSEKEFREKLGHLNTRIPYNIFHRNVLIAMGRAKKLERWLTNKFSGRKKPRR